MGETISLLLNDVCVKEALQDFWLNRQARGLSHFLFADDRLLFFKGSLDQAVTIKNILTVYEDGIGQ